MLEKHHLDIKKEEPDIETEQEIETNKLENLESCYIIPNIKM